MLTAAIEDSKKYHSPLALVQNHNEDLINELYESFRNIKNDKLICSKHYMLISNIKNMIE